MANVVKAPEGAVVKREAPNPLAFLEKAKPLPTDMAMLVNHVSWARALLLGERYMEPNPNHLNLKMLTAALNSESLFGGTDDSGVTKLQEWVTDAAGSTTGPIEVFNVYVAPSKLNEGQATYILMDVLNLTTGEEMVVSTGATAIQGFLLKALCMGHWPIRCQFARIDRVDKGGRHLFNVFPPDGM